MTLGELIECGLVKDDDTVLVYPALKSRPTRGVRRGNWYQDQILHMSDQPIEILKYICGEWSIYLMQKEV